MLLNIEQFHAPPLWPSASRVKNFFGAAAVPRIRKAPLLSMIQAPGACSARPCSALNAVAHELLQLKIAA
jgi:hypothetical protein